MKKFLLLILLAGIFGCTKKTVDAGNYSSGLSGKYALYKEIDTTYDPTDVLVETLAGDTAYINYGTPGLVIEPNEIAYYDPKTDLADTLSFVSNTTGYETGVGYSSPNPFAYSLSAGLFNDGDNSDNGTNSLTYTLSQLNSTTIKLLITEKNGSTIEDSNASYFRKL